MLDTWSNPWFFPILLFFFFFIIFSSKTHLFVTADTISTGQSLTGEKTLVSKGENFVLGFFTPGKSLNYYIGIWYNRKKVTVQTVVWVANRENPLKDPYSSELKLLENGNLVLLNESKITIWSTNSTSNTLNSSEVVLGDDGNLVLRNGLDKSDIIWQSFDYPTDTLVPGAKLNFNKLTNKSMQLTSWKNSENPAKGIFSIELDPGGTNQFFIQWNESRQYWNSGPWNGHIFINVPEMRADYIFNFSYITNENENYFTYNLYNNYIISRCVLGLSGQVQQLSWLPETKEWNLFWSQPIRKCDVYAICGPFSSCNDANSNYCQCLEGFEPRSKDWNLSDRSLGCVRRAPLQCGVQDGFLSKSNIKLLAENRWSLEVGSAEACKLGCWNSCFCSAYSYIDGGCSMWGGDLLNVRQLSNGDIGGEDFYLRLAASELRSFEEKKKKASNTWVIVGAVAGTLALLGLVLMLIWRCRTRRSIGTSKTVQDSLVLSRWRKKREGTKSQIEDLFDLSGTTKNCEDTTEAEISIEGSKQRNAPHLPLFDFKVIANATNNFSDANKLGMGGFGHVYKGMLQGGQVVAVKRLSKNSGQGLKEFKNEVILISKLQHRNLVKLLGCCIEGEEKMLLYEYMPNKSLDSFLFDPTKQGQLNWPKRFHIVEGIARGLLYLHRDSRLKIIHRDLKAGNILLDDQMNPKISDFGMARIFGGNQTLANTKRVVGTYGYMSPEYAMEGRFSEKSDVFSFGVLLLEVVSGKRTNQCYLHENSLNLVGFAWQLWNEGKEIELMDPTLRESHSASEVLRCIHVGLLCVQEHVVERPTMSNIVQMLGMDSTQLPTPRQPGFTIESGLSLASQEMFSTYNVTITEESGR